MNKRDVLCGDERSLSALGVVAGDLLYLVSPSEERGTVPTPSEQRTSQKESGGMRGTEGAVIKQTGGEGEGRGGVPLSYMAEFLSGEMAVDVGCTPLDLLCFTLHTIMRDSGFSVSCTNQQIEGNR